MNIGARLRSIRKNKKLTLEKVHDLSNISIATLSEWETNKRPPSLSALERWSDAVGIDFWDIFIEPSQFTPSPDEMGLIMMFRKLKPDDKTHFLALLKLAAKN